MPFLALEATELAAPLAVADLLPETAYVFKARARTTPSKIWSNLSMPITCSTLALQPHQPRIVPPHTPPTLTSLVVGVQPAGQCRPHATTHVQLRALGAQAWSAPIAVCGATVRLDGLKPASVHEVRAYSRAAGGAAPVYSDVVTQRTAAHGSANMTVYRISELCGGNADYDYSYGDGTRDRACEPDNLYNHDSGELLADVEFINAVGGHGSFFVPDFNGSVTSRYCVAHVDAPFADYVSCNGRDTEHYSCACNVFIDRCIGRLDTSSCVPPPPPVHPHSSHMPECTCDRSSTAASARYIGAMPVFYPFPRMAPPTNRSSTHCNAAPLERSTLLGQWYSMPSQAECDPSVMTLPGPSGCTWSRRATHHFLHGAQLLDHGFNLSRIYDDAQLRQNRDVIDAVLAQHPVRCCDC